MFDETKDTAIVHILYDKKTGRIVHKHTSYNVEKRAYEECRLEEIIDLIGDDNITLNRITNKDPKNLNILLLKEEPNVSSADLIVDVKMKKLVERPRIKLSANKNELIGDGIDCAVINMEVVDNTSKVMKDFSGTIKITTSKGKLSTKGGFVQLKDGKGKINLTSVSETVDRVKIAAHCTQGICRQDSIELAFL